MLQCWVVALFAKFPSELSPTGWEVDRILLAAIIKSNERKYHQTEGGSQLLEPFLTQDIGTFGDGPKVNKILAGTYSPPPSSTDATIAFLEACKRPENFIESTPKSAGLDLRNVWCRK